MKNISKKKKNKGYSFVEVIISITLLFFIITTFVGLFALNIDKLTKSRDLMLGANLAQAKLEELNTEVASVIANMENSDYLEGNFSYLYPADSYFENIIYKLEEKPFDDKFKEVLVKIYKKTGSEKILIAEASGLFPCKELQWGGFWGGGHSLFLAGIGPGGVIAYDTDRYWIYAVTRGDDWNAVIQINKIYSMEQQPPPGDPTDPLWERQYYILYASSPNELNASWCTNDKIKNTKVRCDLWAHKDYKGSLVPSGNEWETMWDRNKSWVFPGGENTDYLYNWANYGWNGRPTDPYIPTDKLTVSNFVELWPQITTSYDSGYVFVAGLLNDKVYKMQYNNHNSIWHSHGGAEHHHDKPDGWPYPAPTSDEELMAVEQPITQLQASAILRIYKYYSKPLPPGPDDLVLLRDYSGDYWRPHSHKNDFDPTSGCQRDANGNIEDYRQYNGNVSDHTIVGVRRTPIGVMKSAKISGYYANDLIYISNENITGGDMGLNAWIRKRYAGYHYYNLYPEFGRASYLTDYFRANFWSWYGSKINLNGLAVDPSGKNIFVCDEWREYIWRTRIWQINLSDPENPILLATFDNKRTYTNGGIPGHGGETGLASLCMAVNASHVYIGLVECDGNGDIWQGPWYNRTRRTDSDGLCCHVYQLNKNCTNSSPYDLLVGTYNKPPEPDKEENRIVTISGIAVDNYGTLFIADYENNRLYRRPGSVGPGGWFCYPYKPDGNGCKWISNPYYLKTDGGYLYYINNSECKIPVKNQDGEWIIAPVRSLMRVPKFYRY